MIAEPVGTDACRLSARWKIEPIVARMLVELNLWASVSIEQASLRLFHWPGLFIISGHRARARQLEVNPDVPNSLHMRCPSPAVDLRVGRIPGIATVPIWSWLGAKWKLMGGRWGGDFTGGQPGVNEREMNHFDVPSFGGALTHAGLHLGS